MTEREHEIELYDYIEVLLKYKWFILVATLVCGGGSWILRPEASPPSYEADVVLMIKNLASLQVTGGQQEAITAGQSSGFYEALARDDGLKQALIDSLGLNMSLAAMDGILQIQILDPGVKLTVRHPDPQLPIPLVNAWASLFVARNSDLNSEEGSRYYDYVETQYETTRNHLDSIEVELHAFENDNLIGFLQIQQAILDSTATKLYRHLFALESTLQDTNIAIQATNLQLRSMVPGFRPTYQQAINQLQALDATTPQEQLYDKIEEVMRRFDEESRFSYWANLYIPAEIDNLNKELAEHPSALGNQPNPVYLDLTERLAKFRTQYEQIDGSRKMTSSKPGNLAKTRALYSALEAQQSRIKGALNLIVQKKLRDLQRISLEHEQKRIGDSLSAKMRKHQRLLKDRELLSETLNSFSALAEGARISRAKAANDIRVLTQALEVRTISSSPVQQKTAIAAGVGLLLSSILSLLIEYMRKAKGQRATANKD